MSKQSYSKNGSSGKSASGGIFGAAPIPDGFIELVAERFKVLGEPMRLRLIQALMADGKELSVTALVEQTGATQANISRHLQTLTRAGILARRKDGLHVYYRIGDPSVLELCEHVCGGVKRHNEARARLFK